MAPKDDEPKKPEDAPDGSGPMLDMSQAAVKKMIATAKSRGYITYDELNEVLPQDQTTSEQIEDVMAVNVTGLFHLSQLVGRHMIERRTGSIVNIASILGLVAAAPVKQASYCASKGAVVNLTREMGAQWARKGVRVNAIAPGWFPSEMTADMVDDQRSIDFVQSNCPMGRFGEQHELDGALLFLASDASTYCTGQILAIDGGWTAR